MPELPEVEIAARNLRRWTEGRAIVRADVDRKAQWILRPASPRAFTAPLAGARFRSVRRLGKQLLIALETGAGPLGVLSHLGMTGKWLRRSGGDAVPRFSRARLHLDDGTVLHYADLRLFGRLRLVPGARFEDVPQLAALGPDPLEQGIDPGRLGAALARRRVPVKVALLDQALLPGVGNIQASESLFRARIDPRRTASSLSRAEVRRLAQGIRASIEEAIAREQGDEIEYVEEPGAENPFQVYGREGDCCPRCGRARIERVVQAQRSTFLCPTCQK